MANGKCRVHGGASTGPKNLFGKTNAKTHGIYLQHLNDSERVQYNDLDLGAVDHELRLTRIRLARALDAENKNAGTLELSETTQNDGGGENLARESRKLIVKDYASIIDRLTARVESLEKTRQLLIDAKNDIQTHDIAGFEVVEYAD